MLKNAGRENKTEIIGEKSMKIVETFDSILLKEVEKLEERMKIKPNTLDLPHEKFRRHLHL